MRCGLRALALAGVLAAVPLRGALPPTEYEVKAAFLYNLAKYIQWPEPSHAGAARPFVIGLIGKDPFGPALDQAMAGRTLQQRPVVVRRFVRVEEVTGCDLLFVAASAREDLGRILTALRGAPVLTVADMDQFAERGGMINLTMEEKRVRFEINNKAIARAGLKAGSQLLRLARIVNDSQPGGN
jgi:hypothetical protein